MILVLLVLIAGALVVVPFFRRDEEGTAQVWNEILSSRRMEFYKRFAARGPAREKAITSSRAAIEQTRKEGNPLRAARLELATRDFEEATRDEAARSSLLRRMLSALR